MSRTTKVTKIENGQPREYTVAFDELVAGDLLGRGQFGTVKKMHHPPSDLTFAVKVRGLFVSNSSSHRVEPEQAKPDQTSGLIPLVQVRSDLAIRFTRQTEPNRFASTAVFLLFQMIMDDLSESSSQIMDLEAPKLIGDGCPHLIKFYGAMHADVNRVDSGAYQASRDRVFTLISQTF